VSESVTIRSRVTRSLAERGTFADHVRSRKCRLISPSMVGTAKLVKFTPRSGSKRSTAFKRAKLATW